MTNLPCPSCTKPLREFQTRQVCDACHGMLLALPDLAHAITDITGLEPELEFHDEAPGTRACPKCAAAMTTLKLRVALDHEIEKPRPVLDRCVDHGLWFDKDELAAVFEKGAGKGPGGGKAKVGKPGAPSGSYGWKGHHGVPEWWGGGGGGKW